MGELLDAVQVVIHVVRWNISTDTVRVSRRF